MINFTPKHIKASELVEIVELEDEVFPLHFIPLSEMPNLATFLGRKDEIEELVRHVEFECSGVKLEGLNEEEVLEEFGEIEFNWMGHDEFDTVSDVIEIYKDRALHALSLTANCPVVEL